MSKELPAKIKRVGLSGPEKMFWQEMDAIGATVEAFIFRSPKEWFSDFYAFKVTRADGSTEIGLIPWDLATFSEIIKIAKGEA